MFGVMVGKYALPLLRQKAVTTTLAFTMNDNDEVSVDDYEYERPYGLDARHEWTAHVKAPVSCSVRDDIPLTSVDIVTVP